MLNVRVNWTRVLFQGEGAAEGEEEEETEAVPAAEGKKLSVSLVTLMDESVACEYTKSNVIKYLNQLYSVQVVLLLVNLRCCSTVWRLFVYFEFFPVVGNK